MRGISLGQSSKKTAPDTPHLAGQPAIYLRRQLQAYRSRERRHEVMNVVASSLTDAQIEELARWYESVELSAKPRP